MWAFLNCGCHRNVAGERVLISPSQTVALILVDPVLYWSHHFLNQLPHEMMSAAATEASLLELSRFVALGGLGGLGVMDPPNTGLAMDHSSNPVHKITSKSNVEPTNAISCPPLVFSRGPKNRFNVSFP